MKKLLALLLALIITLSLCSCGESDTQITQTTPTTAPTVAATEAVEQSLVDWVPYKEYTFEQDVPVKNVILVIGDGMGENIIKASEVLKGEELLMRGLPNKTYVKTNSLSGLTDSAAAATAMSCGIKTYNKYLGMTKDGEAVETICEFAMARNMKTGIVCTQILPHATPAGMVVHNDSRGLYNNNFKQMILSGVDVMLGGGGQYYSDKNVERAAQMGYKYIETAEELSTLTPDQKALGVFSPGIVSINKEPRLDQMTSKALELLKGDNGFFLMVEGSDIDAYEHQCQMDKTIEEMKRFEMTLDTIFTFAQENPGTLVIVTADHETGGVTLPENPTPEDITNDCFTSNGEHTDVNVALFAAGAQADRFNLSEPIENTQISVIMREVITETYGDAEVNIIKNYNE